jgi:hypothetical protein
MFVWMEAVTIALLVLASAGAAWQRRAPRTKYAGSRGPRNVFVVAVLVELALLATTRPPFRHTVLDFFLARPSMRSWSDVLTTIDSPILLFALLSLIYTGTIAYYYLSSTRKPVWEN